MCYTIPAGDLLLLRDDHFLQDQCKGVGREARTQPTLRSLTLTTCEELRSLQRGGKLPLRLKLGIKQGSHQPTILPFKIIEPDGFRRNHYIEIKFQGKVRKGKVGFGSKQSTLMSTTLWDSNHIVRHIIPAEGLLLLQDRGEGVGRRYP
jgi:hypothetical protein